ncbi:alkaline shock response membrane anchor protein AmaP [Glycomyces sp. A-F 0318]|uniref:alkaline shock response membrane anchor protein AmaP n=1 Tax=Glycomyces amatae TaxID=2881355 RepID=UPI001E53F36E|nr:alkaline shock response membrane anchor protein AmaP [Glycomyces amatae]MCD0446306.1 alkaline shock response membrane anchor protein AmaP [Glycomyces amatae]
MSTPAAPARPVYQRPPARILILIGAVYVLAGIVYTMASVPNLFTALARIDIGPHALAVSLAFVRDIAQDWARAFTVASFSNAGRTCLQLALFALPTLWLAALVRSARARTWRPAQITVLASLVGLIGIPIATWIGWLLYQAWRISVHVWDFIVWIMPWVARVFFWIGAALVVGFAIWGCYQLAMALTHNRQWVRVLVVALAVAAVAGAAVAGWLDGIINAIAIAWAGLVAGIEWLVALVAPVLAAVFGFIGRAIVVILTVLLIVGALTASFGQMGRTVCLPFPAAVKAGAAHGKCADFAAGAGVAGSLLLTATVLEPTFNAWFTATWETTPVFEYLLAPTGIYGFLIPGSAEAFLRPAFNGFAPMLDVALLLLLTVIGAWSLLFAAAPWKRGVPSRLALPVMIAAGIAIGTAMFVLLLMLAAAAMSRE